MSIIKNFIILILVSLFSLSANSQEVKKVGKFKDWEAMVIVEQAGKVCFAQSAPVLQAPKSNIREARMFVSFRPGEKISNEISITSGYEFKAKGIVTAKSGKRTYDLFSKGKFAWVVDDQDEAKLIKTMKKASRLMITGNTSKGNQTTDHYSMMGFTKAYNTTKKNCS